MSESSKAVRKFYWVTTAFVVIFSIFWIVRRFVYDIRPGFNDGYIITGIMMLGCISLGHLTIRALQRDITALKAKLNETTDDPADE